LITSLQIPLEMADNENEDDEVLEVDFGFEQPNDNEVLNQNSPTDKSNGGNDKHAPPLDETESKKRRAERFGLPLRADKTVDAKIARKERFGIQTESDKREARMGRFASANPSHIRKKLLEERAERFGEKRKRENDPSAEERGQKKQKREERFGVRKPTTIIEKRKWRQKRFNAKSNTQTQKTQNGKLPRTQSTKRGAKGTQNTKTSSQTARMKRFGNGKQQ